MISIDVRHPDVTEFISVKNDLTKVTGANISVRVNNDFMNAVNLDQDYLLHWPCDIDISKDEINAVSEYNKLYEISTMCGPVYLKKIKAKELFHTLCENNWNYAEPGILYWDHINDYNIISEDPNFEYAGTNPCKRLKCRA